mmetsp:Transcript_94963/g.271514  ORF Transcript_94963/g.271514 Transcript_94963/m.271514 type:complete len:235 (+) Transcript_94963:261-965(+)
MGWPPVVGGGCGVGRLEFVLGTMLFYRLAQPALFYRSGATDAMAGQLQWPGESASDESPLGVSLWHTNPKKISIPGRDGWVVEWRVEVPVAVTAREYTLYQNLHTTMREVLNEDNVVKTVFSCSELWTVPPLGSRDDEFKDHFLIPDGWRFNQGSMVVTATCWVEEGPPDPSYKRQRRGEQGLWGSLLGRHEFRSPPAGTKVEVRTFRAAWEGGGPREMGDDIALRNWSGPLRA